MEKHRVSGVFTGCNSSGVANHMIAIVNGQTPLGPRYPRGRVQCEHCRQKYLDNVRQYMPYVIHTLIFRTVNIVFKYSRFVDGRKVSVEGISDPIIASCQRRGTYPLVKTFKSEVLPQAPSPLNKIVSASRPNSLMCLVEGQFYRERTAVPACAGQSCCHRREALCRKRFVSSKRSFQVLLLRSRVSGCRPSFGAASNASWESRESRLEVQVLGV